MGQRFFYSTCRAAAELGISPGQFRRDAAAVGEEPLVFEGRLAFRWIWTAAMVSRIRKWRECVTRRSRTGGAF